MTTGQKMAAQLRANLDALTADGKRLGLIKEPISSEEAEKKNLTDFMGLQPDIRPEVIVEVASDSCATLDVLTEYARRLMVEEGPGWDLRYFRLVNEARTKAFASIVDEIKQKQGYTPPKGA